MGVQGALRIREVFDLASFNVPSLNNQAFKSSFNYVLTRTERQKISLNKPIKVRKPGVNCPIILPDSMHQLLEMFKVHFIKELKPEIYRGKS